MSRAVFATLVVVLSFAVASALTLKDAQVPNNVPSAIPQPMNPTRAPNYEPYLNDNAKHGISIVKVAPNQPEQNAAIGTTTLTSNGKAVDASTSCACVGQPRCACAALRQ